MSYTGFGFILGIAATTLLARTLLIYGYPYICEIFTGILICSVFVLIISRDDN